MQRLVWMMVLTRTACCCGNEDGRRQHEEEAMNAMKKKKKKKKLSLKKPFFLATAIRLPLGANFYFSVKTIFFQLFGLLRR